MRSVRKGYNKEKVDQLCECFIKQPGDAKMEFEMMEQKCLNDLESK